MGQPNLRKKLMTPKLEQFSQRIVFYYHLEPLDSGETAGYIKFRLKKAGNEKADIFTKKALNEIRREAE